MSVYVVGQTNLRIEVESNVTLTGAVLLIKYIKPNKSTGSFSATINGTDASKMYYDTVSENDLDIAGDWIFWSHAVFADTTVGKGAAKMQKIYGEGEV